MALVNPNIALSVKPVELADPMAQYGRIAQFQAAQNQNQLAQYQLGAAQRVEARDIARTNALAGAGSDETAIANALLRSGDIPGYSAFVKAAEDRKTQRLTQQKTQGDIEAQPLARRKVEDELFSNSMKQIQSSWGNVRTPEEALAIHDATHRDPIINKRLQALGVTEEMGRRQILEAAQSPQTFAQFVQKAQLGAEKFIEMNKPTTQVVDQSGQRQVIQIPGLGGKPVTVGTYADTPLPASVEAQRARIALAGRAPAVPAQPVAPTITQIVDPANPNQMITIDARRYQGGSVGSPGVLGVGGKEPAAAVRENKVEAGKSQLADDLENLRASFLVLDQKRAIPSTERGVLSNIASATAASGVGQMLGRATGTTEQVEREVINSARTRLVNSIKNATGMSAQQLNSNVELQTMLKSISDPAQPVQAALRIIEDIENAYVKGAGMPKKNAPARSLTPQDQEALNWANSNPNDPRAAQIKQRLGAK